MGTPITIALPTAPDIGIIPGEQMGPMFFAPPPVNVGRRPLETLKKKRKEKKHRHHKKRKRHRHSREDEESEDEVDDDSLIPDAAEDPESAAAVLIGLDETQTKNRKVNVQESMTGSDVEPRVLVEKV